jgi:putative ABC transport system substrate-binding protein
VTTRIGPKAAFAALALAALSQAAIAQRGEARRIGFLGMDSAMQATRVVAFRDEMAKLGFVEGRNLAIEYRWAEGRFDQLPQLAAELVAQKVEVIVTAAPPAVRASRQASTTVPIVMLAHDPVGLGFAASLARPGGNVTGVTFQDWELSTKRLDLFRSVVPGLTRLGIIWNEAGGGDRTLKEVQRSAESLGIATRTYEARGPAELAAAVASAKAWGAQGVIQLASPVITKNRKALMDALAEHRMPASCEMRMYVEEGCLMTYSADLDRLFRAMAATTVRILNGARPGDLAVEQAREFDFVINMKTAAALKLTVPPEVMLQATARIE